MDVNTKEIQINAEAAESAAAAPRRNRQRGIQALSIAKVTVSVEAVKLDVEPRQKPVEQRSARARINEVISTINVASETAGEIRKLVKSIGGIAAQAGDESISAERRGILENEARELVAEIKRKSDRPQTPSPGPNQEVRLEIEQRIGKALEVMFPEGANSAFGIGDVGFSAKDSIINVRTSVAVAARRLDELAQSIDALKAEVGETLASFEVAAQNSEAAGASIRDVDAALKLAAQTKAGIGDQPKTALESVGEIDRTVADLLGS